MSKNVPVDKELYNKMVERAKSQFPNAYPSAYASAWIVRQYKKYGGEYRTEGGDLDIWFKSNWIDVVALLKEGKVVKCGEGDKGKACRPIKRLNKDSPITIPELLELHSVKDLLKFAERKANNMELKAQWRELEFK